MDGIGPAHRRRRLRRALTATDPCGFGRGSLAVMSGDDNALGEFLRARREQLDPLLLAQIAVGNKPRIS